MDLIREFMHFGSFWTIWFWVTHAVVWSLASHFAMGVPYDMIVEANREDDPDGPWAEAADYLIRAQVYRFSAYHDRLGVMLSGIAAFILSMLLTLGIVANLEMALAIFTLMLPLILIYVVTVRVALSIRGTDPDRPALRARIRRLRLFNQLFGLLGIIMAVALAVWIVIRDMVLF